MRRVLLALALLAGLVAPAAAGWVQVQASGNGFNRDARQAYDYTNGAVYQTQYQWNASTPDLTASVRRWKDEATAGEVFTGPDFGTSTSLMEAYLGIDFTDGKVILSGGYGASSSTGAASAPLSGTPSWTVSNRNTTYDLMHGITETNIGGEAYYILGGDNIGSDNVRILSDAASDTGTSTLVGTLSTDAAHVRHHCDVDYNYNASAATVGRDWTFVVCLRDDGDVVAYGAHDSGNEFNSVNPAILTGATTLGPIHTYALAGGASWGCFYAHDGTDSTVICYDDTGAKIVDTDFTSERIVGVSSLDTGAVYALAMDGTLYVCATPSSGAADCLVDAEDPATFTGDDGNTLFRDPENLGTSLIAFEGGGVGWRFTPDAPASSGAPQFDAIPPAFMPPAFVPPGFDPD